MGALLSIFCTTSLKGKLRLRQVTRLCDGGHQTNVITSRWDLCDIEVAYRMFERWRQENFFKYMREEFLLDALVDYQIEPEDPTRTIPQSGAPRFGQGDPCGAHRCGEARTD